MDDIKLIDLLGIKDIEITKTEIDTTEKCHGIGSEVKLRHLPMGNCQRTDKFKKNYLIITQLP